MEVGEFIFSQNFMFLLGFLLFFSYVMSICQFEYVVSFVHEIFCAKYLHVGSYHVIIVFFVWLCSLGFSCVDEDSGFDALQTLADLSLMMPESTNDNGKSIIYFLVRLSQELSSRGFSLFENDLVHISAMSYIPIFRSYIMVVIVFSFSKWNLWYFQTTPFQYIHVILKFSTRLTFFFCFLFIYLF